MDIREIAAKAAEFQHVINDAKARVESPSFAWYPYDSLGNFFNLEETLSGASRRLLDLIADEPVLDVGCGDGDVAFFLESLGCRVDAIDNPATNWNEMRGVWSMKQQLQSRVKIYSVDVDASFGLPTEHYGAAFLLGVLYHLKNPFLCLEQLARHARYCFLSTRIAALTPDRRVNFFDTPLAYLLHPGEANSDATNFWIFSNASLRRLLDRANWEIVDFKIFGDVAQGGPSDGQPDLRAFCCARSRVFSRLGAGRLLDGWYALESNSWRWTARRFSVEFREPPSRGTLTLRFALPSTVVDQIGPVTLAAALNGAPLRSVRYTDAGEYTYRSDVETRGPALVEFSLDKALPPQSPDVRELGLIVRSVEILPRE